MFGVASNASTPGWWLESAWPQYFATCRARRPPCTSVPKNEPYGNYVRSTIRRPVRSPVRRPVRRHVRPPISTPVRSRPLFRKHSSAVQESSAPSRNARPPIPIAIVNFQVWRTPIAVRARPPIPLAIVDFDLWRTPISVHALKNASDNDTSALGPNECAPHERGGRQGTRFERRTS